MRLPSEEPGDKVAAGRRVSDLTDLACPPYDVIDEALQTALLARHERNAVRLELPAGGTPHTAAASTLEAWLADGTLQRNPQPLVFYYAHATTELPHDPTVHGVLARVRLEPYGTDVRAHEHTMPGPKADRLEHLRATRTQVSPILAAYFDRSDRYRHVMGRAWTDEWRARDGDGLLHTVGEVEADDRLLGFLSKQRLYIADGHHRYETALAYQAEVRSAPPHSDAPPGALAADWIMMVLVNAEMEELDILPTHRLILGAANGSLEALVRDGGPIWQVEPTSPRLIAGLLEALNDDDRPVFGLVLSGDRGYLLTVDAGAAADRMGRERVSTAVARLDLAVLHAALLDDLLGIDAGQVAAGERLAYTRSEADARRAVESGEAQAAVLVRPTRLEQLAAVATAGDVMPQKSTYFYPKLLTGMVFNPLED